MTHTAESIYRRNSKLKWERNDDNDSWTAATANGVCIAFRDPLDYEMCGRQAETLNRFNEMTKSNRSKLK
jgi:hypothetical protein|tara:strand:- start:266 stop:475 length:210 start_codon:yes stop_codon:yes gene_type:complete